MIPSLQTHRLVLALLVLGVNRIAFIGKAGYAVPRKKEMLIILSTNITLQKLNANSAAPRTSGVQIFSIAKSPSNDAINLFNANIGGWSALTPPGITPCDKR